jgi:hypothetical protein
VPPPHKRSGGGKALGIVLGILGGLVVLCGGGGAVVYFVFLNAGDPEEVVEEYFAAASRGDCDTMVNLVTEETWRQGGAASRGEAVADCEESIGGGLGLAVTLDDTRLVSEGGDRAVVAATTTTNPEVLTPGLGGEPVTTTVDYTLRKEGRDWRIDATTLGPGFDLDPGGIDPGLAPELPDLDGIGEDPPADLAPEPPGEAPAPEPGSLGQSPEDAVLSFYGAWQRSECSGMVSLSTTEYWVDGDFTSSSDDPTTICEDTIAAGEMRTDLTYVNEGQFQVEYDYQTYDVAVATVIVRHSFGNEPESSFEFTLIDVGGYWTIHGSRPV